MTDQSNDVDSCKAAAAARIEDIKTVFDSIKTMLITQTQSLTEDQAASPKAIMAKLSELQSAHITLLKAEEAFHDKYGQGDTADSVDHAAIGLEIGRRLDRIRAANDAGSIPAEPDTR